MASNPTDVTVAIEGSATIYDVKSLRETLLAGLGESGDVRIDLAGSGKWDLAGLQLLISCVNTVRSQGRAVRLSGVPRLCAEVAERSGLSDWIHSVSE